MQKPFEFTHKNYKFRIHHLEDSLANEERARYEAEMIVKWQESPPITYPPRKEWVFKNLEEMIEFRGKKLNL